MLNKPYTLLIPAAGEGSRFVRAGYQTPKPLLPLHDNRPMITHVVEDCIATFGKPSEIIIACKPDTAQAINAAMAHTGAKGRTVEFEKTTRGAAETVLLSLLRTKTLQGSLVVANSDQRFSAQLPEDFDTDWDGVLTFKNDFSEKWSYLKPDGEVIEKPLSSQIQADWHPTCGIYYFSSISALLANIAVSISYDVRHGPNQEFYLAPMLLSPQIIPTRLFVGLGTPEDYETYLPLDNS